MGISMNTAPLYRALADDTRRKIITLLLEHSYCVSELARKLQVSESAVSQHLKVLKQADMAANESATAHSLPGFVDWLPLVR